MIRVPAPPGLAPVLRTLPYAKRRSPLRDPAPDPGLFGPGSVTWRVMREPTLILGAGSALLLQAANPKVAQGAIDHSNYATDPYGRLERTVEWVTVVCFGTTQEARRATRNINRLHRRVSGSMPAPNGTPGVPPGQPYSASDRDLLRWVHASFVHSMLAAHDALVGGLTDADRDGFVREWDAVAALMGLSARNGWSSAAALSGYIDAEVASGRALPGPGSRAVAEAVLHPPVPTALLRPAMTALAFVSCGLLPAPLRRAYGITWTPAHAAVHRGVRLSLRTLRVALPERLRTSSVHKRAMARAEDAAPGRTPHSASPRAGTV